MLIDTTAMLPAFEASSKNIELGTALVPRWEGEKAGVATGGGVAVLPAKLPREKQRAAWAFLTWFIARDQTAELSRHTGYVPLRKSAVQLLEDEGFYARRPNYRTVVEQLKFARETPAVPSWPVAMSVIGKALRECLAQDDSAEAALSRAAGEVDHILRATSDVRP
jgi:sn-glycerol 3-phosphate transport system substrate-binding protein